MNALAHAQAPAPSTAPDWLAAEMPPGYRNRVEEIERLSQDLRAMDRFGRLLWAVGPVLNLAVHDALVALRFNVEQVSPSGFMVNLDARRRMLFHVSASETPIQKKSAELAQVFQMLHEHAEDADRVVLLVNTDPEERPSQRHQPVGAEALSLLQRLGVNVMTAPSLFRLWMMSLEDPTRVRPHIERLHAQDGGAYVLAPPPAA